MNYLAWRKIFMQGLALALTGLLLVGLLPLPSALAQTETYTVPVNGLLVYEQPNNASRLIAVLSLGATVTVNRGNVQNGFTQVTLPTGRGGWAILDVAGVPDPDQPPPPDQQAPGTAIVIAFGNINIRSQPNTNAARIGIIGWGERATLLRFDASRNWIEINYKGTVGWAAEAWFRVESGDINNVRVAGREGRGGSGNIRAFANIYMREAPSEQGRSIRIIAWGDCATLLGYDSSGRWARINHRGQEGWSFAPYWREASDCGGAPASQQEQPAPNNNPPSDSPPPAPPPDSNY